MGEQIQDNLRGKRETPSANLRGERETSSDNLRGERETPSDNLRKEGVGVQIQENLREGGEGEEIQENQVVWARVKNWPWWPGVVSPGSRRGKGGRMRKVVMFGRNNQGDE